MPKILMVSAVIALNSDRGGAIHQRELILALRKKNNITVVSQSGARAVSLGAKPQPLLTAMTFLKLVAYTKKFDMIHDRGYLLGGAGVIAGAVTKVPAVLQVDDNWLEGDKASGHLVWRMRVYERLARVWIRFFVKHADALVVVSNSLKEVAVKEWGASPKKIFVVGNGVNLVKFNPQIKQIRSELGIPEDAEVLTFVGEMAPWHGVMELVKAAELAIKKRKELIFVFAGGTKVHEAYIERVKNYVQANGLNKKIIFLGKLPYAKVPSLFASSDILLAPYTQPKGVNFGFSPLKLFEYMAMNKPIVTSDLPWIREILTEKEACFLRDPKDSSEFSEKLILLLEDRNYANLIANNARKLVIKKYSWEKVAERLQVVYEKVLNEKTAQRAAR